jgi:hypothetical protein
MLTLSYEELEKLARDESIWPEAERWEPIWDVLGEVVEPLVDRMQRLPNIGVTISPGGLYVSYYEVFVYDKRYYPRVSKTLREIRQVYEGASVLLCLNAAFGAIGRSSYTTARKRRKHLGTEAWSGLELDKVIDSLEDASDVFHPVFSLINSSRYRLLTRSELAQPLPNGIRVDEVYDDEQDYFHVLFHRYD